MKGTGLSMGVNMVCMQIARRIAVLAACLWFGPAASAQPVFGTWAGQFALGEPVRLQNQLSGLPGEAMRQLNGLCIDAVFYPDTQSMGRAGLSSQGVALSVAYSAEGFLQLGSGWVLNAPAGVLMVRSVCPLATFEVQFPMIAALPLGRPLAPPGAMPDATANPALREFSFEGSSLLAASRKPTVVSPPVQRLPEPPPELAGQSTQASAPVSPGAEQKEPESPITSLPTVLASNMIPDQVGLAPSTPLFAALAPLPATPTPSVGLMFPWAMFAFAALALCLLPLGWWLLRQGHWFGNRGKAKRQGLDNPYFEHEPGFPTTYAFEGDVLADQGQGKQRLQDEIPSRVLESLFPGLASEQVEPFGAADFQAAMQIKPIHDSFDHALGVISKTAMPAWQLPEPFAELVQARNTLLCKIEDDQIAPLRCQVAVVELAFDTALHGRRVHPSQVDDLVRRLLGVEYINHDMDRQAGVVPDLVKSMVRMRMCDTLGAGHLELLRANLNSLADSADHSSLCFGSTAWREFLAEEGMLGMGAEA